MTKVDIRIRQALASLVMLLTTHGLCCARSTPSPAMQPELIPRSVIFGNPERTAPVLSPIGLEIAYERSVAGSLEVWIRTLGDIDDHPVTNVKDRQKGNVTEFFWHADGRHIIYQRDPPGNATTCVYIQNLDTGEARDLTPYSWVDVHMLAYRQ